MSDRANDFVTRHQLPGAELTAFRQRLDAARSLTERARILHELSERLAQLDATNSSRARR